MDIAKRKRVVESEDSADGRGQRKERLLDENY